MKSIIKKSLVVFTILSTTACGSEPDSNEALDGVFTGGQSLSADGTADCEAIHDALQSHGIDPAALDPEVVLAACRDSGQLGDAACYEVAYSCFGPQDDCEDHDRPDEPDDYCTAVLDGIDPNAIDIAAGMSRDELWNLCVDAGHDPELCERAVECLVDGVDPTPNPDPTRVCRAVLPTGEEVEFDANGRDEADLYALCVDHGYSPDECQAIDLHCDDVTGGGQDPSRTVCVIETQDGDRVELDVTSEDELRAVCADLGLDEATCYDAAHCYQQNPDGTDPAEGGQDPDGTNPDEDGRPGDEDPDASGSTGDDSNTDPSDAECAQIDALAQAEGADLPLDDASAEAFLQQCLDQHDEALCRTAYECLTR